MHVYRRGLLYRVSTGALSLVLAGLTLTGDGFHPASPRYVIQVVAPAPAAPVEPLADEVDLPLVATTSAEPQPEQPPNRKPPQYQPPPPPPPSAKVPPATTPQEAVAAAVDVGRSRGVRVAVAVLDRETGAFYGGGDVNGQFASASVMKTFIAARLLAEGKATDSATRTKMWEMIVASNDDAARDLYKLAGKRSLIGWIESRYGINGLAPPPANLENYWGLTLITARAMVRFYDAVAGDPAVGPWLMSAMAATRRIAADGFNQHFGIPAAAASWRVKQGWMCCLENRTRMHSTGFISGDRYTVALMIEGSTGVYGNYGAQTLTLMARALLPGKTIPEAKPTPTPTPSPSPPPPTSGPTEPDPTPTTTPEPTDPPEPTLTESPTPPTPTETEAEP